MKHVIVAVDGSEPSLKGARTALEYAQPFGAKVTLVYVVAPAVMPGDAPWAPLDELHQAELARGQQLLGKAVEALGSPTVSCMVKLGPPAETIAQIAEAQAADMVVVGSRGLGAVKRLLVGSVADRLVHVCTRPVLVVH
jgi:nucleotide-binding universal stress UspA family protein